LRLHSGRKALELWTLGPWRQPVGRTDRRHWTSGSWAVPRYRSRIRRQRVGEEMP